MKDIKNYINEGTIDSPIFNLFSSAYDKLGYKEVFDILYELGKKKNLTNEVKTLDNIRKIEVKNRIYNVFPAVFLDEIIKTAKFK